MPSYIRRISYYTRKAAQYSQDKRPLSQRNPYRFNRLLAYKAALNKRLAAAGYRWRAAIEL